MSSKSVLIHGLAASVAASLALASAATLSGPTTPVNAASPPMAQKVSGQRATQSVQETDLLQFQPPTTRVMTGDVVEWINVGSVAHNVTFDQDPGITSGTMNHGDRHQVRFLMAGTYRYHCTFHPGMDGVVTVA